MLIFPRMGNQMVTISKTDRLPGLEQPCQIYKYRGYL